MVSRSPLDDPDRAAFAWRRYRKLMRIMGMVTSVTVIVALVALYLRNGLVSIHLYIATALGVAATMMLMAALMGLVFLSSGTGHDDSIDDPLKGDDGPRW